MKKTLISAAIAFAILSSSQAFATPITLGGGDADDESIAIGRNAKGTDFGYAYGNDATATNESIASGEKSVATNKSTANGSNASATDSSNANGKNSFASDNSNANGNDARATQGSVAYGDSANATGLNSAAFGLGASAIGIGSAAIGSGSVATGDYEVSFGNSSQTRRLTNLSGGIASTDAATYGQLQDTATSMQSITDSMSVTLSNFGSRIGTLESTVSGMPASGGVDSSYADAGDARTLSSAQTYSDIGDAQTYGRATSYADAGDARTLQAANDHADAGDARLNNKIRDLDSRLSAGIAAVAAQPMLPSIAPGQKALAVGTGHYNGKNAIGISFGYAPRPNMTYGFGVSAATDSSAPVFRTFVTKVW